MRNAILIIVLVALPGCMVDVLTSTAIMGELAKQDAAVSAQALQHTKATMGKIELDKAIQTYQAERGYYPATLQELVPQYIATLPQQANGQPYGYDSSTGQALEGPAATGPTRGDNAKMQEIYSAINAYGYATGYYPGVLEDLVPNYLASVPKTDSGQSFLYDNQDGALMHPQQGRQVSAGVRPRGAGGAGAGPMGEALTGIGMQQQLSSGSNAGSSAAGGYARGELRDIQSGHNDRQNQVMDDLGL